MEGTPYLCYVIPSTISRQHPPPSVLYISFHAQLKTYSMNPSLLAVTYNHLCIEVFLDIDMNPFFFFSPHQSQWEKQHRLYLMETKPLIKTRKRTAAFLAGRKWALLVRKREFLWLALSYRLNTELFVATGMVQRFMSHEPPLLGGYPLSPDSLNPSE